MMPTVNALSDNDRNSLRRAIRLLATVGAGSEVPQDAARVSIIELLSILATDRIEGALRAHRDTIFEGVDGE